VSLISIALEPFFGIETTAKRVDIDDVSEMKTPDK
jgi:hypothetical protein